MRTFKQEFNVEHEFKKDIALTPWGKWAIPSKEGAKAYRDDNGTGPNMMSTGNFGTAMAGLGKTIRKNLGISISGVETVIEDEANMAKLLFGRKNGHGIAKLA